MTGVTSQLAFVNVHTGCGPVQRVVVAPVALLAGTVEPAHPVDADRIALTLVHVLPQQALVDVLLAVGAGESRGASANVGCHTPAPVVARHLAHSCMRKKKAVWWNSYYSFTRATLLKDAY